MTPSTIEIPAELQHLGLHPAEQKLLALMRTERHGILAEVKFADGIPVFVREVHTNIKLV